MDTLQIRLVIVNSENYSDHNNKNYLISIINHSKFLALTNAFFNLFHFAIYWVCNLFITNHHFNKKFISSAYSYHFTSSNYKMCNNLMMKDYLLHRNHLIKQTLDESYHLHIIFVNFYLFMKFMYLTVIVVIYISYSYFKHCWLIFITILLLYLFLFKLPCEGKCMFGLYGNFEIFHLFLVLFFILIIQVKPNLVDLVSIPI